MSHLPSLGPKATLIDVYRRYPAVARHTLGLAEAAFDLSDEISHPECEMLGAYISNLNGCTYCRGIHTEAAVVGGIDRAAMVVLPGASAPSYGGERWRPVFGFVHALTTKPSSVDADLTGRLQATGWSEDAIVQLIAVCSVFNVLNRLVEGLGLSADEAFQIQAGKRLATVGYAGTAKMLGLAG